MTTLFDNLPQNVLEMIFEYDNTYYEIFNKTLDYIKYNDCIAIENDSDIYPFRITNTNYDENGILIKTNPTYLDNYMLGKFIIHNPAMTFYKLCWGNFESRLWVRKIICNSTGYLEMLSIIENFKETDVFVMVFTNSIYYDRLIKKVFICDNYLHCPEYSKEPITVKLNTYFEKSLNGNFLKSMRLEYINTEKDRSII